MNLQYISDSQGKTIGVFIPITEWNLLKSKYQDIDKETINVPEWQKDEVGKRMAEYQTNPNEALDFETALDDRK